MGGWDARGSCPELGALLQLTAPSSSVARDRHHRGDPGTSPAPPLPKFRDGGLLITYAGATPGLVSAIIGGVGERRRRHARRFTVPIGT
jgi:hypothetical protein